MRSKTGRTARRHGFGAGEAAPERHQLTSRRRGIGPGSGRVRGWARSAVAVMRPRPALPPLLQAAFRPLQPLSPLAASSASSSPAPRSRGNLDRSIRLDRHSLQNGSCKAQNRAKQSRDAHCVPPRRSTCFESTSRIVEDHAVRFFISCSLSFPKPSSCKRKTRLHRPARPLRPISAITHPSGEPSLPGMFWTPVLWG